MRFFHRASRTLRKLECLWQAFALHMLAWDNIAGRSCCIIGFLRESNDEKGQLGVSVLMRQRWNS